jgi:hypothetical protein
MVNFILRIILDGKSDDGLGWRTLWYNTGRDLCGVDDAEEYGIH